MANKNKIDMFKVKNFNHYDDALIKLHRKYDENDLVRSLNKEIEELRKKVNELENLKKDFTIQVNKQAQILFQKQEVSKTKLFKKIEDLKIINARLLFQLNQK